MVDGSDDDSSSSVSGDDIYRGRAEPVLVLLSNSYSEEEILVCDSRPFSCPALHILLTTSFLLTTNATQFWSKKTILL